MIVRQLGGMFYNVMAHTSFGQKCTACKEKCIFQDHYNAKSAGYQNIAGTCNFYLLQKYHFVRSMNMWTY